MNRYSLARFCSYHISMTFITLGFSTSAKKNAHLLYLFRARELNSLWRFRLFDITVNQQRYVEGAKEVEKTQIFKLICDGHRICVKAHIFKNVLLFFIF